MRSFDSCACFSVASVLVVVLGSGAELHPGRESAPVAVCDWQVNTGFFTTVCLGHTLFGMSNEHCGNGPSD